MSTIILKDVRLSYPDLFKRGRPPKDKPNEPGKYGAQFIFDPESPAGKLARETLIAVAQAEFGPNWQNIMTVMEKSKKCVRKGNENLTQDGAIRDGYKDKLYVVARNKVQPLIIGPARTMPAGTNTSTHSDGFPILTESDGKPYGGCIVSAKVTFRAMKAKGDLPAQVFATLQTVQFRGDGEAFGAAPGTAEGMDDEAPAGAAQGSPSAVSDNDLF